jgi:hypothetical protein
LLDTRLPRWHRASGTASHSLTLALDEVGADWRVLADGTVWVGVNTWPEVEVKHVLEDEDYASGVFTIAPEAPDLAPAVTFLGQRIEVVKHFLSREGHLRTEAHIVSTASVFSKMMGKIRREIDYSRSWACTVVTQNADGTLQLKPDDPRMKAGGLDKVRIRLGMPGTRVKVPSGARLMLSFNGGDPADPYAESWDQGTSVTSVDFEGTSAGLGRKGDQVDVFLPDPLSITAVFGPGPYEGNTITGAITPVTPAVGIIATGSDKFRA